MTRCKAKEFGSEQEFHTCRFAAFEIVERLAGPLAVGVVAADPP